MSYTRYKIRIWGWNGEASVAHTIIFNRKEEAEARFNILHTSEKYRKLSLSKSGSRMSVLSEKKF